MTASSKKLKPHGFNLHQLEIRALLNGATQLRIPIQPQPEFRSGYWYWQSSKYDNGLGANYFHTDYETSVSLLESCKSAHPVQPGQIWFVREPFGLDMSNKVYYKEGFDPSCGWSGKWNSASLMKHSESRIIRRCVSVGVARVSETSCEDAIRCGVSIRLVHGRRMNGYSYHGCVESFPMACNAFESFWRELHGSGSWEKNPWVWVVDSDSIPESTYS